MLAGEDKLQGFDKDASHAIAAFANSTSSYHVPEGTMPFYNSYLWPPGKCLSSLMPSFAFSRQDLLLLYSPEGRRPLLH